MPNSTMSSKSNNNNSNNNSHAAANNSFSSQADNKSIYTVEINTQTEDEKITLITKEVSSDDASAMLRSSISSNNNKLPSSLGTPGSALSNNRKPPTKHNSSNSTKTSKDKYNSSAYTISSTDELSFEESILDESPLSLLEKNSKQRQQLLRGETYRGGKGLPLDVQRKRLLAATSQTSASGNGNKSSVSVGPKGGGGKSTRKGSEESVSGKSYKSQIKQMKRQANVPTTIEELSIDSYSISQAEEDEEKWTKSDDKWLEESSDGISMNSDDDGFSVSVDEEISILSQMEQRCPVTSHKLNSKSKNMNSKEKKKSWLGSWGSSEKKKEKDTYSMESPSVTSSRGGGTTISSSRQSMTSRSVTSRSTASRSNTSSSRSYHSGPSTLSPQSEEAASHHLHSIQEDDENELPPSSVSSQYQTNISNLVSSSMIGSSLSTAQTDINESTSSSGTKRRGGIFSKLVDGKSSNTVASRLGYHPPSPIEKQRVDNLLNNEFPQENNLHNISTPGGHRSDGSSSSTSSCVKRARELLVDIESRGPSYDDDSSYNTNNNGRRKRRICNNNNKILSKKGCLISTTILLLIFGIVGTLTSLNVIMLPKSLDWRAFSLGNNNSSAETENTNNQVVVGGEIVSTEVWYVNWDIYKCVKDCIGPLPCGGERTAHLEVDFGSLESCCKHGFEVYISNDWSVEECIEVSSYGIEPNNDEDEEDTEIPTFSPVIQGEIKTRRPNTQPTVVQGSRTPPSPPNDGQFDVPATEDKEMYYANWDTNKCTLQSSLSKKPWDIGYETEEECCIPNFGWISDSDCYNDGSSGVVDPSQSAVDNSPEDESDSLVYYPDFVQGKCLPKSSSATHSRFQHTFATYDKCCHDNFRWNVDSDCYTEANYTVDVTTVIDKRDDTLPPAITPPQDTVEGTDEDNKEDTSGGESSTVDLSDIIGTASPSVTPTSSTQKYYADFTARTCILKPVSTMARWDTGYESHDTCCMKNFSYDPTSVCYVGEQDAVTTTTPATSIASEEIEEGSTVEMLYFAHFDQGKCIEDTAEQGAKWGLGYSTQDECCHAYFKYSRDSSCYDGSAGTLSPSQTDNGDRIIDNGEVILVPSDSPTYLPTSNFPTLVPSKSPSTKPTLRPSNSPIELGTPTESPEASPSSSPTDSLPTSHPTQKPTHKPSVSPTVGSTNAPTASPLDQLEVLSAELIVISPESTEDLEDSSSSQYRAMKWLTGNVDYATYDSSRKVQRWALATFYRSLSGPDWGDNSGWMEDDDTGDDECTWYGITCDTNGIVISINLEQNDVGGKIPYEIALLDNLESLVLNTNFISGISSSVFSLVNLQMLDLDKNFIEELPSDISLPVGGGSLQRLYLSNNKLTTISDELFKLKQVTNLWLSNNRISSTIPTGIGMMTNLQELDLESNLFEGPIPTELYSLSKLHTLILHDNMLNGSISPLISQMTSLRILDLDSNAISGELPAQIGFLSQLSQLHLGNNAMIGQIPWPQLSMLAGSLEEFDMSENYLSSTIGFEVGSLSNLVKLKLDNNYRLDENDILISNGIQGPVPGSIGGLSKLEEIRLDNNYVGGAIPASIWNLQSLVVLRLESNNLQSSIPSTIGNLANLQYFHLWSNYISSTIPGQLGRLTNLRELFLDDNELTGYIPPELGQLTSANYISLAENNLSGVIPPTFGMLSSIGRVDLQFNNLVGEVPSQLGNLPLGMLKLEGNNFYGDIPEGICQNIQYLSGNCSTGRRRLSESESVGRDWGIVDSVPQNTPTPSPTFNYWWSCNCCTTCYPGEQ